MGGPPSGGPPGNAGGLAGSSIPIGSYGLGGGQPPFPKPDQSESPTFSPDEYGRFKKSSSKFRPEFHLDLQKSLDKYTFCEYLLGCIYVAETLVAEGRPVKGYLSHLRFIAWKSSMTGAYQTQVLIKYDQHVSTKVIRGTIPDWVVGEEEAMCLYLGVDGTYAFKQLTGSVTRSSKGAVQGDFSDFPQDVCWLFNFRSCDSSSCKRKHICSACSGLHRAKNCKDIKPGVGSAQDQAVPAPK